MNNEPKSGETSSIGQVGTVTHPAGDELCEHLAAIVSRGQTLLKLYQDLNRQLERAHRQGYKLGFKSGVQVEPLSLLDIAPLLLYSLRLPIPEEMEGRLPVEILRSQPSEWPGAESSSVGESRPEERSEEEEVEDKEILIRQLKRLGYMD